MRTIVVVSLLALLLAAPGCKGRKRRRAPEPQPVAAEPMAEPVAQPIPSDPCSSQDRAHHWIYYPDEPLYFCDRHRHHWIPDGVGGWAHIHEYDRGRPNYAAPILANQSEFTIYERHAEHAAQYPPGSRR